MRFLPVLVLTAVVGGAPLPAGASDLIDIGGVPAALGADKNTLVESLREKYDVTELRSNTYVVFDGDPSEKTVGVLQFRDDKLVWASRDVGAYEGDAVRTFARSLFAVLAEVNPEERTPIHITTSVSTSQPLQFGSVTLEFPGRRVIVDIGFDDQLVDASIEEILYVDDTPGYSAGAPAANAETETADPASRLLSASP